MLVAQEFGRALAGGAWLASTVMAGELLTRMGNEAQKQAWLTPMANGQRQAAVALYEKGARYTWTHIQTQATAVARGFELSGYKTMALHGDQAGTVAALLVQRVGAEHHARPFVALGLDVLSQRKQLEREPWAATCVMKAQDTRGKQRYFYCLRGDRLAMWLATLTSQCVQPELSERLAAWQCKAADALARWTANRPPIPQPPLPSSGLPLPLLSELQQMIDSS